MQIFEHWRSAESVDLGALTTFPSEPHAARDLVLHLVHFWFILQLCRSLRGTRLVFIIYPVLLFNIMSCNEHVQTTPTSARIYRTSALPTQGGHVICTTLVLASVLHITRLPTRTV